VGNRRILYQKRQALLVALAATGLEAMLVAVALILSLA
jgi:hypothetical protein